MSEYQIECQNPYWQQILEGKKTVEGRKGTEKWSKIRPGDTLLFVNEEKKTFRALVTKVNRYTGENPLTNYLVGEGLDKTLPGVTTIEQGKAIYLQWSTEDEIKQHGFLGIQVEVLSGIRDLIENCSTVLT